MQRSLLFCVAALAALTGCDDASTTPAPLDAAPLDAAADATEPEADPGPEVPAPLLEPDHGSMAGYFPVRLDLTGQPFAPDDVIGVTLGGVAGVLLEAEGDDVGFTVQGHREPGPVDLVIRTADSAFTVPDAFTYDPPLHPELAHVVAIGASISQGFQAGAIDFPGLTGSPPARVARQLGAYMGLPLLVDGLFPPFAPDAISPPPLCQGPDATEWAARSVGLMVPRLAAASGTGAPTAIAGRLDPTLAPSHLALSGARVADALHGPTGGGPLVLGHLVYETDASIFDPLGASPVDIAEGLAPDVILAIDFYGNDVLFDDVGATPEDEQALRDALVADITATIERLAATGAEVFPGDMPPSSVLPGWRLKRAAALEAAEPGTEEAVAAALDAEVAALDARTRIANEAMYAAAARFDNVHPVPTAQTLLDIVAQPLELGGQTLTIEMFGGLIGYDAVHFTDTGSALAANVVIETMNDALGLDVPSIDLEAVLATDPESPAAARDQGIAVDACLR